MYNYFYNSQTEGNANNLVSEQKETKQENGDNLDTNGHDSKIESRTEEDQEVSRKTNAPKIISKIY